MPTPVHVLIRAVLGKPRRRKARPQIDPRRWVLLDGKVYPPRKRS